MGSFLGAVTRAMSSLSLRVDSPSGSEKTDDSVGLALPVDEGGELKGFSRLAFISLRMRERYLVTASDSIALPRAARDAGAARVDDGYSGVVNGGKRIAACASRLALLLSRADAPGGRER